MCGSLIVSRALWFAVGVGVAVVMWYGDTWGINETADLEDDVHGEREMLEGEVLTTIFVLTAPFISI